ncbi:hypothetical protein [Sorangium sp. So ce426]|uniref:hypothetical protein n=1 Tax=Sorangium sp. So ce426 TaxID=3133312 RepID=UPI003F5C223D
MSRSGAVLAPAAALGHLGLVILGALFVYPRGDGRLTRALSYYGAISGADLAYTFFAPNVDAAPWATFQIMYPGGASASDTLGPANGHEEEIRIRSVVSTFFRQPTSRSALVASWADEMLSRHPGAESVVVRLEACALPSMREYRAGRRPRWNVRYEGRITSTPSSRAPRGDGAGAP